MAQPDYVYGVFDNSMSTGQLLEDLHKAGFKSADLSVVGTDCPEFRTLSAKIKTPVARYFVQYGIVGALGGMWAGTVLAPQISTPGFFQILTTLMGAVSGSIVMAYWGLWIGAFLHANEPQYYANVFEGEVKDGIIVVLAEANSREERRKAMEIMDEYNAVEITMRLADLGQVIGLETPEETGEEQSAAPKLFKVA